MIVWPMCDEGFIEQVHNLSLRMQQVKDSSSSSPEMMPVKEVMESDFTANIVENVKQKKGMFVSTSRTWILTYSILTWLLTIAFFAVVVRAYGFSQDNSPDSQLQKRGILQSVGCLSRKSFLQWNDIIKLYEEFYTTTPLSTMKERASTQLLQSVMSKMSCHVGVGTANPSFAFTSFQCVCVTGLHSIFSYQVNQIMDDTQLNTDAAKKESLRILGKQIAVDGKKATSAQANDGFGSIMQQCFFAYRPSQWIKLDSGCGTQVVPYAMAMYVNTIAGCFAALYFVTFWGQDTQQSEHQQSEHQQSEHKQQGAQPNQEQQQYSHMFRVAVRWTSLAAFLVVNLVIGIAGIVIAFFSQENPSNSAFAVYMIVYLLVVGMIVWQFNGILYNMFPVETKLDKMFTNIKENKAYKRFQSMISIALEKDNMYVSMRMLFWVQYLICMPIMLMLYDGLHQSRMQVNTISRLMMSIGIGFLAFGFDVALAIHEKLQMDIYTVEEDKLIPLGVPVEEQQSQWQDDLNNLENEKNTVVGMEGMHVKNGRSIVDKILTLTLYTGDNATSCTWWSWMLWIGLASSLFALSSPMDLPPQILESLVPGSTTAVAFAVIFYVLGMPIVARVPGMNIENTIGHCWMEDRHATSLSLCLAVDFVARTLLTLTLTYWLIFDAV